MSVYLITYDLNREVIRPNITGKIKEVSSLWAKLSESSYAIKTNLSVDQVYGHLKPLVDENDNIYIISLGRPYVGFGPPAVNDWLHENLP